MEINEQMMRLAIKLSEDNVAEGGGPFGAVVVKNGKIVATGVNRVFANNDPTAHAEIEAIREAARQLKNFDMSGCEIYTSCEPCPMCLAAIYWAKISKIYYGNTKNEAKDAGFDDSYIYDEIGLSNDCRQIPTSRLLDKEALVAFEQWKSLEMKNLS